MDVRRDVIDRLRADSIDYYITGSEAMAIHGIAYRSTNDIDIVLGIDSHEYEDRIRPLFEPAYLVTDLIRTQSRWLGGAVSLLGVGKADMIIRDRGPWADSAFRRRVLVDDPELAEAWVSTPEDLVIAKLEWSEGSLDGLQGRDIVRLIETVSDLDWRYMTEQATALGLADLLEAARRRA